MAVAVQLLQEGHTVVGLGRNAARLEGQIEETFSGNFHFLAFDLSQTAGIEQLVQEAAGRFGKFDGLVHCAGMEETLPLSLYTPEKVRAIYEVNIFAAHELVRTFSKKKCSNDEGSILLFSSVMGLLGQAGKTGYCATKAAVLGLVKAAALELAKRKIRINAILPGVVATPMTQHLFEQLSPENVQRIVDMHPLGLGQVSDITPMVSFLLAPQTRWVTGQSFVVDGGYSIQ